MRDPVAKQGENSIAPKVLLWSLHILGTQKEVELSWKVWLWGGVITETPAVRGLGVWLSGSSVVLLATRPSREGLGTWLSNEFLSLMHKGPGFNP